MIEVDEVTFAYRGVDEPILAGLSCRLEAGAVTAITGPSGTGKSTLLYVVGLLLRPAKGRLVVGGADVSLASDAVRSRMRARYFGFVFQDAALDPTRTILESVIEPALYAGLRRSDAIDRATSLLTDFGVEARIDHRPGEISGGQAQRVALCRALLCQPPVVLADEPTGNLDSDNSRTVLEALGSYAHRGGSVVIATHDPQVVARADAVVTL